MSLTNVSTDAERMQLAKPMAFKDAVIYLRELMSRGANNWDRTVGENPVAYLSALKCYSELQPLIREKFFGRDVCEFQEDNYLNRWRSLGI